ncbi:MAG: MBL fold metallo-hydrolase [Microvirga sp.]
MSFPFPAAPLQREVLAVATGVYWARLALPYRLNHVNVYLIEDGPGWTLVDTGVDSPATRADWSHVIGTVLAGRPVTQVLVTHFHPDHMGAAGWLCRTLDAPLLMTRGEYAMSQSMHATPRKEISALYRTLYMTNGLEEDGVSKLLSNGHDYISNVGPPPEQFMPLAAGDVLRIGGRDFRILTGGGHAPEQAMLYQPDEGFLICADQVLARISPNVSVLAVEPHGDPLRLYLKSLLALRDSVPEGVLALPGHDLPFYGLHSRIAELRAHHQTRCAMIEDACHLRPMTATELVPFVFGRHFGYQQLGFAITETLAHVNMLLGEHRLTQEVGPAHAVFRTV